MKIRHRKDRRLAFLLRVGWRARHELVMCRILDDLRLARDVAAGTHPAMKHIRGVLPRYPNRPSNPYASYEEFKVWRADLLKRGKTEVVRLERRLAQVRAMENPHR